MIKQLLSVLQKAEAGYSLGIYRIGFGLLMCYSLCRFYYNGWVEACYLEPSFHFTYQYFHWVRPILDPIWFMHFWVILTAIFAFLVALGWCYRLWITLFFLSFTYLELIEQSWYLNHYYFVSIVAFLLIWMPADRRLSIRAFRAKQDPALIAGWFRTVLRFQITLVYFFAGLAKINKDWILDAMPLKLWLKAKVDIPLIGDFMAYDATAYLFSYGGMVYDLSIAFFLWNKRTRPYAFVAVIGFHIMTGVLFRIGLFPWIMIFGSLIFFSDEEWRRFFEHLKLSRWLRTHASLVGTAQFPMALGVLFGLHLSIQVILPIRHYFYLENHRWTERYYRFGWNVMLTEKAGTAIFTIKDKGSDRVWKAYPQSFLTYTQEKQMSYQPDMIWQFAQYLEKHYQFRESLDEVEIFVDCRVSYNGQLSRPFLPVDLDLLTTTEDAIYDFVLK
ncbi:MAG: HTTM domain-containing protein [Bacteroidota bacterium]